MRKWASRSRVGLCWLRMMLKLVFSFTGSFWRLSTSPTCGDKGPGAGRQIQPGPRGPLRRGPAQLPALRLHCRAGWGRNQATHHAAAHEHGGQLVGRQVGLLAHQRLEALEGQHRVDADVAQRLRLPVVVLEIDRVRSGEAFHGCCSRRRWQGAVRCWPAQESSDSDATLRLTTTTRARPHVSHQRPGADYPLPTSASRLRPGAVCCCQRGAVAQGPCPQQDVRFTLDCEERACSNQPAKGIPVARVTTHGALRPRCACALLFGVCPRPPPPASRPLTRIACAAITVFSPDGHLFQVRLVLRPSPAAPAPRGPLPPHGRPCHLPDGAKQHTRGAASR